MKTELQEKLFQAYPNTFKERTKDMSETCMCWGIDTGDGWYHIIDNLCKNLLQLEKEYDIIVVADQVKEKYGSLRFYYHIEYGKRWTISDLKLARWLNNYLFKMPSFLYYLVQFPIRKFYNFSYNFSIKRGKRLDGKLTIEYYSMGWKSSGKKMYVGEGVDRVIEETVRECENISYYVCEKCGMTGATQNERGWISTFCDKCKEENKQAFKLCSKE